MMEEKVEAVENEVSVEKGIEEVKEVEEVVEAEAEVEVGAENEGCDDIVKKGEDEADNSYVMVSGSDVIVEDVENGNASEVLVELRDGKELGEAGVKEGEIEGLDRVKKGDREEDGKAHCVVENGGSLLVSGVEENQAGETDEDEVKPDVVDEVEIVDKEAEKGEAEKISNIEELVDFSNSGDVQEAVDIVEVEYLNKLDDVRKTLNVVEVTNVQETENVVEVTNVQETENVAEIGISNNLGDVQVTGNVVDTEDTNKSDDVQETENYSDVEYLNQLEDVQETENVSEVEISNKLDGLQETGNVVETEFTNKSDDVQETENYPDVEYLNKLEDVQETENVSGAEFSNTCEDVQQTVCVASSDHEWKSQQLISGSSMENGTAVIGISVPDIEETLDADIEFTQSKESEHDMEGLEKENNIEYSIDKQETQDLENFELEEECNENMSLDLKENQDSNVLLPSDAHVNLMELEQAGNNSVVTNVTVNQEPCHSEQGQNLANKSKVSSGIKENGRCESFIPVDELDLNRDEQNHSANVSPLEANAECANAVILKESDDFPSSQIGHANDNNNTVNNIASVVNSTQLEKSEAASAISIEQEENGLEYEAQVDNHDNETADVEQSTSKDIIESATKINNGLQVYVGTECAGSPLDGNDHVMVVSVEVVQPDTGDSNLPIDNEWPELSCYNTKKKFNTDPTNEAHKSQELKIRESEKMHSTDPDRKEARNVIPKDDNLTSHEKEVVDASLSAVGANPFPDTVTPKKINQTGHSTAWADYNDQTNGKTSPSVLSSSGHSQTASDGAASPSNLENEVVATLETGSKSDDTTSNGKTDASKIESSSSEGSTLSLIPSEVESRPFLFLIKVPRFEDDVIREKIKFAQQDIDEKTRLRDSFKVLIQTKRDMCTLFYEDLEAAEFKAKAARESLKAKRKEIDAAQAVIDKVNNAMTVEDIEGSIRIMEHRMQHETVPLSEEKQLMREIKRLKHFKEQLSSSIGTPKELEEALDQKDQIRDHLKSLKKELNSIRSDVQSAEIETKAAKKKWFDESAELKNSQLEFKAANDVRQEAYMSLVSLRRDLAQKNKLFRVYKDTEKLANDYTLSGDKKSLHSLCVNQVETVMELWNNNDQFRRDYIKYNARSTLRRLKTLDGRSLGPDEEPPSVPYIRTARINHSEVVSNTLNPFHPPEESIIHVPSVAVQVDEEPALGSLEKKEAQRRSKPSTAENEFAIVPSLEITAVAEEVKKLTEEEELAKKAEEIRKKDEEAKVLEQLQLEERAKAKEALERKKRMAERAQARAKLRAKKEAEEREKEREKRLRKKEKRKDGKEDDKENDLPASKEARSEVTKEVNPTEKPITASKRHHKPSHYIKSIKTNTMPLSLRNRHRRKLQMWMWMGVAVLAAVAMVLLWFGSLSYLAEQKRLAH